MATVKKASLFPSELATEMFNKVKGHSSIAKLVGQDPIPFNGKDVMTFSMDSDVSIVGESANKPAGGATVAAVQIRPVKVVYQSRISDEFMYASEEAKLDYLTAFAEGFSKKIGEGMDKMMIHGVNPATGSASNIIGNNHIDYIVTNYASGANKVTYTSGTDDADAKLEAAIGKLEGEANCAILNPTFRDDIAAQGSDDKRKYPEFAWGAVPANLGQVALDQNKAVSANSSKDRAIVFNKDAVKWGFVKEIPLEVIEYGDPDGAGTDLKQANEVLLRSEAYIGWGFLDNSQFAEVVAP